MVLDLSGKMLILYNIATFVCDGSDKSRVRTGPGKSWNFILAFSRTGKSCGKKATGPGKFWNSVWKAARRKRVRTLDNGVA